MYKIAVCDDREKDRKHLISIINRQISGRMQIQIYEYRAGEELLEAMQKMVFAAIFLDVEMEGIDGNETAKRIREQDANLVLVFYTGYAEPSPVTFEVQPYRYIMKNMPEEQKAEYVEAALARMVEKSDMPALLANVGKRQIVINAEHIIYIEKYKKSTRVHITRQAMYRYGLEPGRRGEELDIRLQEKLAVTYETLKRYGFGWPHDSYIINFEYLCACTAKSFQLAETEQPLQIARSKAKEFNELKNSFMCAKYVGKGGKK